MEEIRSVILESNDFHYRNKKLQKCFWSFRTPEPDSQNKIKTLFKCYCLARLKVPFENLMEGVKPQVTQKFVFDH